MIHAACLKSSSALPPIRMSMPAGLWRPDIRVCETPTDTARRQGQLGPELVAVDDEGDHFVVERLKLPLRKTPTQLSKISLFTIRGSHAAELGHVPRWSWTGARPGIDLSVRYPESPRITDVRLKGTSLSKSLTNAAIAPEVRPCRTGFCACAHRSHLSRISPRRAS